MRVPADVAQLIETSDRAYLYELLALSDYIDLVIPRGGEALIRSVAEHSRVPVLKHYKGVCAIFVDEWADEEMALEGVSECKGPETGHLQCHGNPSRA